MKTIRTTRTSEGTTLFNAKDIFESLGIYWNGKESLSKLKKNSWQMVKAPVAISSGVTTLWHYGMTEDAVKQLCKKRKLENPLDSAKLQSGEQATAIKEVAELKVQVEQLKRLFASSIIADKSLQNEQEEAKLDVSELTAREQIRALVVAHAQRKAGEFGITRQGDMKIFFDLSFKLLYEKYKQKRNFDIKTLADQEKLSGLQLAQNYGIITDLLSVAKEIFA